jgi:hypothetical protein
MGSFRAFRVVGGDAEDWRIDGGHGETGSRGIEYARVIPQYALVILVWHTRSHPRDR